MAYRTLLKAMKKQKKILELTYGKDVKVLKALIKDLETLQNVTSLNKVKEIHEFYKQLSRIVTALNNEVIAKCTKLCLEH